MCHTAINALGGSSESEAFQGGLIPMQNWYAPSLTSNKEAGLGDWSLERYRRSASSGVSARGAVYGPMAEVIYNSLQYLTDADIRAMAVYLKSLAQGSAAGAPRPRHIPSDESSLLMRWARRSTTISARVCHGAEGLGKPPNYPPLAGNQSIEMSSAVNPIRMVLNGGYPPGHRRQSDALWHAAVRAVPIGRRSRGGCHLHPHLVGQSRRAGSAPATPTALRSAPLD